ncbi:MAG: GNAT family N-acetyltransferase [Promethearchaeota archaeon]
MICRALTSEDLPKILEITNNYKSPLLTREQFEFSYIKDFDNLKREIYVLEENNTILAWGRIQIPINSTFAELTIYPKPASQKLQATKALLEAFEQRCIELDLEYCDLGTWMRVGITEVPKELDFKPISGQMNMKLDLTTYNPQNVSSPKGIELITLAEEESSTNLDKFFKLLNDIFPSPDPEKPYITQTKDLEDVFLGKRFPPGVCFIAKKDEEYIGTGSCFFTDPDTSIFSHFGVLPPYQRKGIATIIMLRLASVSKKKGCSSLVSNRFYTENIALIELLKKLGFKKKSQLALFRKELK